MSTLNLDMMIAKSGMQKQEIAAKKGITPETLSRHINGKIQLTRRDAEEYAVILECMPQEILFANKPMDVVAEWIINDKNEFELITCQNKRGEYPKFYLSAHHHEKSFGVFFNFTARQLSRTDVPMTPWWTPQKFDVVYGDGRLKDRVDEKSVMTPSYVYTSDQRILFGYVYPTPQFDIYNIHVPDSLTFCGVKSHQNLQLEWACPIVSSVIRPDLRDMELVRPPI